MKKQRHAQVYRWYPVLCWYDRRRGSCWYRTCDPCSCGISLDMSGVVNFGNIGGVVLMIIMILTLLKFSLWKKKKA